MSKVELTQLIQSGAHFGHLTRRWNPKMKPYIFMEKNGIHIIDLKKTQQLLTTAADELRILASEGKSVLFVGTKNQAKGVIEAEAKRCNCNWVSERWLGGMLTNFATIRKSVKRLKNIEKQETDGTFDIITKKERLFLTRELVKLKKVLEGVESMNKLPGALFIVDIKKESIAVNEARRLNIPLFAIVDTNCDPELIDYIIPGNDDAVKTIEVIVRIMAEAVLEGHTKLGEVKAEEAAERERINNERNVLKEQKKEELKAIRKRKEAEEKSKDKISEDSEKPAKENEVEIETINAKESGKDKNGESVEISINDQKPNDETKKEKLPPDTDKVIN
ncbi:MAG: hypothetical protein BMS9Abin39_0916 [Ignavibacteria bacterium]|nr:MAG: hypothetical protein BMS9Abin39_0916 [Ignavibacteria bacterium]